MLHSIPVIKIRGDLDDDDDEDDEDIVDDGDLVSATERLMR